MLPSIHTGRQIRMGSALFAQITKAFRKSLGLLGPLSAPFSASSNTLVNPSWSCSKWSKDPSCPPHGPHSWNQLLSFPSLLPLENPMYGILPLREAVQKIRWRAHCVNEVASVHRQMELGASSQTAALASSNPSPSSSSTHVRTKQTLKHISKGR